jgi:hypothetical protein
MQSKSLKATAFKRSDATTDGGRKSCSIEFSWDAMTTVLAKQLQLSSHIIVVQSKQNLRGQ